MEDKNKTTDSNLMDIQKINEMVWQKKSELLARIDDSEEGNKKEVLDVNECPLDMPKQLAEEYFDFLQVIYLKVKGPDAPLKKLVDSWYKYYEWAVNYKHDSEIAYYEAESRNLWERITSTNHKDVWYYKQCQYRYTEYLLEVLRRDFIEEFE